MSREMSWQQSEEVSFHDDSAYFSEEEWKLLHEWQKELYRNVMKEIHQALISLGPLIATTVFSLRAKENQALIPVNNKDSERRHGIPNSPRFPCLNTDICSRKEEAPVSISIDHFGAEVRESSPKSISGHEVVSFHIQNYEEPYCMDSTDRRRIKSTSSLTEFQIFHPEEGSKGEESNAELNSTIPFNVKEEDGELSSTDHRETKRTDSVSNHKGDTMSNRGVLLRRNREENHQLKNPQDTVIEPNDWSGAGFPCPNPGMCLRKEERLHANLMLHPGAEGGPDNTAPSSARFPFLDADFCMRNEDESPVSLTGRRVAEGRESSTEPSSAEHVVIPEVVLVRIKEEEETYSTDHEDSEIIESISSQTGDGSAHRQKNVGKTILCTKNIRPCKASSSEINTSVLHSADKGTHSRSQLWSEGYHDLRGERTYPCESGFRNSEHFNLHHGMPPEGTSQNSNECESNQMNPSFPNDLPNTQQNETQFTCTECGKSYSRKGELVRHIRTHSGVRPYECPDCEKSFIRKTNLITHRRTHSGEKPYACIFCHKRFNRKYNMKGHLRIHTGERPYKCTECDKSFIWKGDLNLHQRKHI